MINRAADRRRIGVLELLKSEDPAQWDVLKKRIEYVTPARGNALFARTAALYPVLRQNIPIFSDQIGKLVGDVNAGLQYGPLLAGAYLLTHDEPVEPVDAYEMVKEYDWRNFGKPEPAEQDEHRCLNTIMGVLVQVQVGQHSEKATIGDLVNMFNPDSDRVSDLDVDKGEARKALRHYGIKAESDGVYVAHHANELEKLLQGPWQNWRQHLKRLKEAITPDETAWLAGTSQRFTKLPWNLFD